MAEGRAAARGRPHHTRQILRGPPVIALKARTNAAMVVVSAMSAIRVILTELDRRVSQILDAMGLLNRPLVLVADSYDMALELAAGFNSTLQHSDDSHATMRP